MLAISAKQSAPPANMAPPSDNGSSSLSELDDGVDYDDDNEESLSEQDNNSDDGVDTEAETERLDTSPQKAAQTIIRLKQIASRGSAASPPAEHDLEAADEGGDVNHEESERESAGDITPGRGSAEDYEPLAAETEPRRILSPEMAGKKRKRTDSPLSRDSTAEQEPAKKRSQSVAVESKHSESDDAELDTARNTPDADLTEVGPELASNGEALQDAEAEGDEPGSTSAEDDAEADADADNGEALADDDADKDIIEEAEAEDEEAAANKIEDEIMKKKGAMDALAPIEKLFAIFRDKLFDERLQQLSDELEQLQDPDTTHPEFLEMRRAVDARRDEKITLEHVALRHRLTWQRTKTLAERAQLHSQFMQTARQAREDAQYSLNEHFCQIQKERRQWKAAEPEFVHRLPARRAQQLANQRAYNKEVSLLAGIAAHVGFPAAPTLERAADPELEDDLRSMKISPRPKSYTQHIANSSRAEEAAAEEQFLEKTPWANPKHPIHANNRVLERRPSASSNPSTSNPIMQHFGIGVGVNAGPQPQPQPPLQRAALATPANQRWLGDMYARGVAGSGGSTLPAGSDLSSSVLGSANLDRRRSLPQIMHADVNGSSPFAQAAAAAASRTLTPTPGSAGWPVRHPGGMQHSPVFV